MARPAVHSGISDQWKASCHRWDDASVLLANRRWRAAMYLGGYSVECALKWSLMQQFDCLTLAALETLLTHRGILARRDTVFTHEIETLLECLDGVDRIRQDPEILKHFNTVNEWIPAWRYSPDLADEDQASTFLESADGIRKWLRNNV